MENDKNSLFDILQSITQNINSNASQNTNVVDANTNNTASSSNNNNFNIMDILNSLNLKNNTTVNNNPSNNSFDISNILKIQKIISTFNEEDPRKNFLISIKPFLRKTRQEKIDEYITYLSVINAIGIFTDKKE